MAPPDPPEWDTYSPDSSPDDEPAAVPPPARPPAPPRVERPASRRPGLSSRAKRLRAIILLAGAAGIAVPLLVAVVASIGGDAEPQTPDGFADLVAVIEDELGTTEVFEAVIYPGYAVVSVPLEARDEREVRYYWDGDLSESSKGTSDYRPFDLADVDGSLMSGMCEEARGLVDEPGDCYVIVRRPGAGSADGWFSAYVSNEFSQGGYISYDLAGQEVRRHVW